ncbi:hypothetical protein [Kitasatospora sp. MBT63]|uniref:wHTH domain-containing protein n=1 Tax=Kitasatospora sp. MBT63 TaxID=1444768 RepID=UPI00053A60DF|nr:hypothetical protein [Kitasatospora sp. MBT63]
MDGGDWFGSLKELERRAKAARTAAGHDGSRTPVLRELNLAKQTVSGWFGRNVPPDFDDIWPLIEFYLRWAGDPVTPDVRRGWHAEHRAARPRREPEPDRGGPDWAELIRRHPVWAPVPPECDDGRLLARVAEFARRLELVRQFSQDDPWLDPGLPARHLDRVTTLLNWMAPEHCTPAEAALLTLTPLLDQAYRSTSAVRTAAAVGPQDLGASADGSGEVRGFHSYLLGYPWLVRRARQRELPGREPAAREIGWWLFHRWMAEKRDLPEAAVADLLTAAGADDDPALRELLRPRRVAGLLHALRLGPGRLADDEALGLAVQEHLELYGGHRPGTVRLRLIGLLLAVARVMALEPSDLPMVLVEHLGVPHAVDLDRLRDTVGSATWRRYGPQDPPKDCRLEALCDDPATLSALREQVERVDALLRVVHRLADRHPPLAPLRRLPTHASPAEVQPARGEDRSPRFSDRTARFTVDERQLRELLMGSRLYGSPTLAIREMYQNALDACRYRRARVEYQLRSQGLDVHPDSYRGEITFLQDVDQDGRPYLECRDNGVGMGEEQLLGVFSRAGSSFTGTDEFVQESADWERHGIRMFPNSRFGIGVLSYFMLADEIRVTTCRMHRLRGQGPTLEAIIAGPGHLFRIESPSGCAATPHTVVRLYLREGELTESCVDVLQDLVKVSEFTLHAVDLTRGLTARWTPWTLNPASRSASRGAASGGAGRKASEPLVHARRHPQGQVIWRSGRMELLVDGVRAAPAVRSGLVSGSEASWLVPEGIELGDGRPAGAFVNLCGPDPVALSVDRKTIVEDVTDRVELLLRAAAVDVVESGLLGHRWIWSLGPALGDIVTEAAVSRRRLLAVGPRKLDLSAAGFFQSDLALLETTRLGVERIKLNSIPDHLLLWRLLALDLLDEWPQLAEEIGDREALGPLLPALPSDGRLLGTDRTWREPHSVVEPGLVLTLADDLGRPPAEVAARMSALGVLGFGPDLFADRPVPDRVDRKLLGLDPDRDRARGRPEMGRPEVGRPVPIGRILEMHVDLGTGVHEIVRRLRGFGCPVPLADALPDLIGPVDRLILSRGRNGRVPWLDDDDPVPAGRIVTAAREAGLSCDDVAARLRGYGFVVGTAFPEPVDGDLVVLSRDVDGEEPWLAPGEPVSATHVLLAASSVGAPAEYVRERLAAYGFEPDPVPPGLTWSDVDRMLISVNADEEAPWFDIRQPVPLARLALAAWRTDRTVRTVAAGLVGLGFDLESEPPAGKESERDLRLLGKAVLGDAQDDEEKDESLPWDTLATGRVLRAAQAVGMAPEQAVRRLTELGFTVRHGEALTAGTRPGDLNLLSRNLDQRAPWLTPGSPVGYGHVVRGALHLGVPVAEVARRLRRLGIDARVPVGDEATRDDLVLLSTELDGRAPYLAEGVPVPLYHLASAARLFERPLKEIADRLRVLGHEVADPAETVRRALALVPWAAPSGAATGMRPPSPRA